MTTAETLVLRDLLDAAVAEDLAGLASASLAPGPEGRPGTWVRVRLADGGCLAWRARADGVLQRTRYVDGPVLVGPTLRETTDPAEVLALLAPDAPCRDVVARDLATAVSHVLRPSDADGEVAAAARGRPFHPTARAVGGWTRADLDRWGPGRTVAPDWVAVREDHLRHGRTPLALDDAPEAPDGHRALPVHPFDREHVLPNVFAREIADGVVVPLARGVASGVATASLRTLDLGNGRHLKMPLGVTTLGSARLLGARSLDHGQRGEQVLRRVLAADPELATRVAVADETAWSGFAAPDGTDEFHDRPGHLAALVRRLPPPGIGTRRLPLAALAFDGASEELFASAVRAVVEVGIGFLRHGVLPEMHGQNVLLDLSGERVVRVVLRDHDAVRVHPRWLSVPDPAYRLAPGGTQSLRLDTPGALIGFFATLAVEVGLGGLVDALARATGRPEPCWWPEIRRAVEDAVGATRSPVVRSTLHAVLLDADTWPYRSVLRPLLERGPSRGTSMPAGVVRVPNPLRAVR
ncbi:siderophore synthetase component [Actinomycetospora succinea]|uniref:Siderophore synthetase component n=1 Tax=Actinomycetospora succinea TaxID=663603 RepID=A0A4R6UUK4_9PSEU|nr:IucA/IucC family protein [Actinomycetospora succinea]TDQ50990.1 siderophore synthetase component [Actinomycetospora succinea]